MSEECGELAQTMLFFCPSARISVAQTIVVRATDLPTAQRERRGVHAQRRDQPVLTVLEVEAVVAESFEQARLESSDYGHLAQTRTVRYLGTAAGLAGLVADIAAAGVSDGVVLVPISSHGRTTELIVQQTIPWLYHHQVVVSSARIRENVPE